MSSAVTLEEVGLAAPGIVDGQIASKRGLGVGLWVGIAIIALAVFSTIVVRVAGIGHPDQISLCTRWKVPR